VRARSPGAQQPSEIGGIAGQHHVIVASKECYVGVDGITRRSFTAQLTNLPRDVAVQPLLTDPPEKPGKKRLAGTASPDLGNAS
jgi:hypothetical protein